MNVFVLVCLNEYDLHTHTDDIKPEVYGNTRKNTPDEDCDEGKDKMVNFK